MSAVVALTVSACSPSAQPTTGAPVASSMPTFQCTPIFGGDPTSCTQSERDKRDAQFAKYAEGQRIYTKSVALVWQLAGAKRSANASLLETATGDYRASIIEDLKENQSSDLKVTGAQEVKWMKPLDASDQGSTLAMRACLAPGTLEMVAANEPAPKAWYLHDVFYKDVGGQLLISRDVGEVTKSC